MRRPHVICRGHHRVPTISVYLRSDGDKVCYVSRPGWDLL